MKTTYKVLAAYGYRGHKQGDTFEADLPKDAEQHAVARGQLERVADKKPAKKEAKSDA